MPKPISRATRGVGQRIVKLLLAVHGKGFGRMRTRMRRVRAVFDERLPVGAANTPKRPRRVINAVNRGIKRDPRLRDFRHVAKRDSVLDRLKPAEKQAVIAAWTAQPTARGRMRSALTALHAKGLALSSYDLRLVLAEAGRIVSWETLKPYKAFLTSLTPPEIDRLAREHGLNSFQKMILQEVQATPDLWRLAVRHRLNYSALEQDWYRIVRLLGKDVQKSAPTPRGRRPTIGRLQPRHVGFLASLQPRDIEALRTRFRLRANQILLLTRLVAGRSQSDIAREKDVNRQAVNISIGKILRNIAPAIQEWEAKQAAGK